MWRWPIVVYCMKRAMEVRRTMKKHEGATKWLRIAGIHWHNII
jgi:hypothetical protein